MRHTTILSFFALVTLAILPDLASAQTQSPIGKVVSVEGAVTIQHTAAVVSQVNAPSGAAQPKAGDFVYKGDIVQTGADGKASLAFADGTAFNISSNARMELSEF